MLNVMRAIYVACGLVCLPALAAAGTGQPSLDDPGQPVTAAYRAAIDDSKAAPHRPLSTASVAPRTASGPPAPRLQSGTPSGRRDSLWNGVIVGAGLGALLGAVGGQALIECSACAGFNVPLTFGVIGAGVGAGLGAAIDSLHSRSSGPSGPARVTVSPLVARRHRGVVAVLRF